nr:hypothetical protein [Gluconobacter sp. P1D12_c]
MQERAGKYDGSASIGAEGLWAEFGENQFSAGVVVIEGEGDGELAVGGTGDGIVPMRVEKAFIRGVVGTDEHSVHLGSRESESPENLGDDAADDTVLQLRDDAPVAQGRVPPAFEIRGDGADRMSCGIGGQDGRGLGIVGVVIPDQVLAEGRFQNVVQHENRDRHAALRGGGFLE